MYGNCLRPQLNRQVPDVAGCHGAGRRAHQSKHSASAKAIAASEGGIDDLRVDRVDTEIGDRRPAREYLAPSATADARKQCSAVGSNVI